MIAASMSRSRLLRVACWKTCTSWIGDGGGVDTRRIRARLCDRIDNSAIGGTQRRQPVQTCQIFAHSREVSRDVELAKTTCTHNAGSEISSEINLPRASQNCGGGATQRSESAIQRRVTIGAFTSTCTRMRSTRDRHVRTYVRTRTKEI